MRNKGSVRSSNEKWPGHKLFFPAAALHAALIVPLSMASLMEGWTWPPGLGEGHGREMLFGFVLALIAGYLLGLQPRRRLLSVFALWLGARLASLAMPGSAVALLFNSLFVAAAVWLIVPKLLAAKKWRNRSLAPLVCVLFLLPVLYGVGMNWSSFEPRSMLLTGIVLLSLLMLFMSGRLIAATAAGEIQRRGGHLSARVQPLLEAGLIVLLVCAALLSSLKPGQPLAAVFLLLAGLTAAIRQIRWRLWSCRRADLLALGAGHAWLVIGLLALGLSLLSNSGYRSAMHIITIGALGTLSITIAARVHLVNLKRAEAATVFFVVTSLLIAMAVLLRVCIMYLPPGYVTTTMWLASAAWSMAYILLLVLLLGLKPQVQGERHHRGH